MPKYKIAWLPGDGVGVDVLEATRIVLDKIGLGARKLSQEILVARRLVGVVAGQQQLQRIRIAADKLGLLFRPFTQVDDSLTRQYGGTGLGLALVRQLAELHGGGVSVQSEPGNGSIFSFSLPYRGEDESSG